MFESMVNNQLSFFIRNRISINQRGFMKGRSTTTNLFELTSKSLNWMEQGYQTDVFYADFQKAFDQVNHKIMYQKLLNMGLSIVCANLSFSLHIESVVAKSITMLGFIKRICRDFDDPIVLKTIFCSFE